MAQTILYYPTVNIQDREWLKGAVLYWDKVSTIVPYKNYDLDPDLLYLEDKGQYNPIYAEDIVPHINMDTFKNQWGNRLRKNFQGDVKGVPMLIHKNKILDGMIAQLQYKGYVRPQDDDWYWMEESCARMYMKYLAELAVTNQIEDIVIGTDREQNIMWHNNQRRIGTNVLTIELKRCLPVPGENVSLETILDFKKSYRAELFEMRVKIRKLEKSILACTDLNEITFLLESFRENWEKDLEIMEKSLRKQKGGWRLGNLTSLIKNEISLASIWPILQENIPLMKKVDLKTGTIALAVIHSVYNHLYRQLEDKEDGFAYIMNARRAEII